MTISANQKHLITQLEGLTLMSGRYADLKCVNIIGGIKRGVMSLVFQAYDRAEDDYVAIKVMDPDRLSDAYRLAAFQREPELLVDLIGSRRALQLTEEMEHYNWHVSVPGSPAPLSIPCAYFVTEWLEEDADDYFFQQDGFTTETKLVIFQKLLLAVEVLHSKDMFHRDIKIDNIRVKSIGNDQILVVIDFGTAARLDTPSLVSSYDKPVGANAFSPPEAFLGFAGDRKLGCLADSYALGALLFNLFNTKEFQYVRAYETQFKTLMTVIGVVIHSASSEEEKMQIWNHHIWKFKALILAPPIDSDGHSIPVAIQPLVEKIYSDLTQFDFNQRTSDLAHARHLIDSAIAALANGQKQKRVLEAKRERRKRRQEKALERQQRLEYSLLKKFNPHA